MRKTNLLVIAVLLVLIAACNKNWEEHYLSQEETIDMSIWDEIKARPELSDFVAYMEEYNIDSLFELGGSYTLFVPTNDAFSQFNTDTGDMQITLKYHMLDYVFNVINVTKSKQIRTSTGKFAPVEAIDGGYKFSDKLIEEYSALYRNGRFYVIDGVAFPLQNLYEYISENAIVLKNYILNYDSIIFDLEESTPLGFDDDGNIIYDSVYTKVNYFDSIYFPVNREDRSKTATFLLFDDEQYEAALDEMAANMGGSIFTGDDIPKLWKDEILMPNLIENNLFPNSLRYEDLAAGRLKNIRGDSVDVEYSNIVPDNRILASNGVIFKYNDFKVPEYLYRGEVRIEGEHMVDSIASGIFYWKPEFKVTGTTVAVATNPKKNISPGAENDSVVSVSFPSQPFNGEYNLEFYFKNMFPQKYLFVWGANYRPSGLYEVYVNDVRIKLSKSDQFATELRDNFDTYEVLGAVFSVNGTDYYLADGQGNNRLDGIVDHLTDFGDVKITIKYIGPKDEENPANPVNGLSIDFISLIPAE